MWNVWNFIKRIFKRKNKEDDFFLAQDVKGNKIKVFKKKEPSQRIPTALLRNRKIAKKHRGKA